MESNDRSSRSSPASTKAPLESVEAKYVVVERNTAGNEGTIPADGLFLSGFFDGYDAGEVSGDMTTDFMGRKGKPVAAIFVHAGAGFHSKPNERYHLEACAEAAQRGMNRMNAGGTAVEAVVEAIKCLEDNTITNAGVGSNLCLDGTVECDATVVDHNGRSGAVGACSHVRYPIMLAEKILMDSYKVLALRRISPILLVGQGAYQYAVEHGIKVVENDEMVSVNARDRWERWSEELRKAMGSRGRAVSSSLAVSERPDHHAALQTGTFNEGQPDSPQRLTPSTPFDFVAQASPPSRRRHSTTPDVQIPQPGNSAVLRIPKRMRVLSPIRQSPPSKSAATSPSCSLQTPGNQLDSLPAAQDMPAEDEIYDTVGVIAIDYKGHMAAGSSSGGIGMKHRGRVGPAALVGIGTAVIPADSGDDSGSTVAAVTSGTGEHIATTMASYKCAERLYLSTVRGSDGSDVAEDSETRILTSFIEHDFMAHPGVRSQESRPAIGIMAVKKTVNGYYFYFGHNTESFALASMASTDAAPHCTMSRMPDVRHARKKPVAGGRKIGV